MNEPDSHNTDNNYQGGIRMGKKTAVLITALVFLFTGAALAAGPKSGGTLIFGRRGG